MRHDEYIMARGDSKYILENIGSQFESDRILIDESRPTSLDYWDLEHIPGLLSTTPSSLLSASERYYAPPLLLDCTEDQVISRAKQRTFTCFYLIGSAIALLLASLGLSIWWSINNGDVSGGFGMGSYMLAISSVIIAVATYMHRSDCRCWVHQQVSPL
ncbi:hypothetical protein F4774DRAFT_59704 [Daldinia eschscholtzii]|nr:hypothetical protein F4774DRAFT_59704 [Daldinia eschscholtzii]